MEGGIFNRILTVAFILQLVNEIARKGAPAKRNVPRRLNAQKCGTTRTDNACTRSDELYGKWHRESGGGINYVSHEAEDGQRGGGCCLLARTSLQHRSHTNSNWCQLRHSFLQPQQQEQVCYRSTSGSSGAMRQVSGAVDD